MFIEFNKKGLEKIKDKIRHYYLYPEFLFNRNLDLGLKNSFKKFCKNIEGIDFTNWAIKKGNKFSQVSILKYKRLFRVDFWENGICLADGMAKTKKEIACSVSDWLNNSWKFEDFSKKYPFVEFHDNAFAYENNKEIEFAWEYYLNVIPKYRPELVDFVNAASENDILKNLFPYMSLDRFCFSRCTGYPYSYDCPYAQGRDKKIIVYSKDGSIIDKVDSLDAIQIIVDNLPANCGKAIKGTKNNLKD